MRIIAGDHRGRKLAQVPGDHIRPTSDRIREALFNILGPFVRGARVLDLFAGTGALGLEAMSRGAQNAVFVDASPASCGAIKENIQRCHLEDATQIKQSKAADFVFTDRVFDLVFMDPPYHKGLIPPILGNEDFVKSLSPEAIVVVEQDAKEDKLRSFEGLDIYRQKKYSRTLISFITPNAVKGHNP